MATQTTTFKRVASKYEEPKSRRNVGWTPAKIKQAETQADSGKLAMAADLCETMFGDDRYSGVMQTLANVVSLPITFVPGLDGVDPETDQQCLALGGSHGDWWSMLPESTLAEIIAWGSTLGVALLHVREWVEDENTKRVVADVDVWSPRWLERTDGKWIVETSEGKIEIEPGDGEWAIWCAYTKKRPWVVAPWRGLARWWLGKAYAILDELDISDKQGEAKIVAEQMGVEYGVDDDARLAMVDDIKALGRKGVYAPPPGVSLKLLESSSKGADICARIIEQANSAFAVCQLGGNLSAEVTGGSFAAASVHSQITQDRIRSKAEWISTESHYQLLIPWAEFNFGTRAAAWAKYDTKPPADKQAKASQLATASSAVVQLQSAGLPLNAARLVEEYDLPIDLDKLEEVRLGQVFQYHLTFGVLTTNEIRERLGLPPVAGGDKPPVPMFDAPGGSATEARGNTLRFEKVARSRAEREALVDLVAARAADDQLDSAEDFIDRLERDGKYEMVKEMRPAVSDLVAMIKAAGVEDAATEEQRVNALRKLRAQALEKFGDLDPELYADTNMRIEILAAMAGVHSASSEV